MRLIVGKSLWILAFVAGSVPIGCSGLKQREKGQVVELSASRVDTQSVKRFLRPKRIAWLVGLDQFRDPAWPPLRYPLKDVADMDRALSVSQSHLRFGRIYRNREAEQASLAAMRANMKEISRQVRRRDDTLLVYFSTHGTLARDRKRNLEQYLVVYDTDAKRIDETALAYRELIEWFDTLPSKRKVLILATCHSGYGKSRLSAEMFDELLRTKGVFFERPLQKHSEATFVLSASSWRETAREDDGLQNDVYTHYFIEGMVNNDLNGDGAVTVSEAHDYARELTFLHTRGAQRPTLTSQVSGTDPILLSGLVTKLGKPVVYSYDERYAGLGVYSGGEKKGVFPGQVSVDAGFQELVIGESPDKPAWRISYDFQPGDHVDFKRLNKKIDRHHMGAALVYGGFFTRNLESRVAGPMLGVDVSYRYRFSLRLPLLLTSRIRVFYSSQSMAVDEKHELDRLDSRLTQVGGRLGLTWELPFREVWFLLGAELGLDVLNRRLAHLDHDESVAYPSAGVQLSVSVPLWGWLALQPALGADVLVMKTDGRWRLGSSYNLQLGMIVRL